MTGAPQVDTDVFSLPNCRPHPAPRSPPQASGGLGPCLAPSHHLVPGSLAPTEPSDSHSWLLSEWGSCLTMLVTFPAKGKDPAFSLRRFSGPLGSFRTHPPARETRGSRPPRARARVRTGPAPGPALSLPDGLPETAGRTGVRGFPRPSPVLEFSFGDARGLTEGSRIGASRWFR